MKFDAPTTPHGSGHDPMLAQHAQYIVHMQRISSFRLEHQARRRGKLNANAGVRTNGPFGCNLVSAACGEGDQSRDAEVSSRERLHELTSTENADLRSHDDIPTNW